MKKQPQLKSRSQAPAPQPLASAIFGSIHGTYKPYNGIKSFKSSQKGFSLVELMLTAGIVTAGMAVVYVAYQNVTAAAKLKEETEAIQDLTQSILSAYKSSYDFGSLNTTQAINDGIFRSEMIQDGAVFSAWGTPITLAATNIEEDGTTIPNWGFSLNYADLPSSVCAKLISQASDGFSFVTVQGVNVGAGTTADIARITELCNQPSGADVSFVFSKSQTGISSDAGALGDPCVAPSPETQAVACPSGQYGVVTQSRSAFCETTYGSYEWTPWTTTAQSCLTCPAPETRTASQEVPCPPGQIGLWTQSRQERRSADCPLSGPSGPTETFAWGDWIGQTSWATVSNTCAPICVLPSPSIESRWVAQTGVCPTGQTGLRSWEVRESRTATCPAQTGAFVWSDWTATTEQRAVVNSCTPCPSAPESRTISCPTGQFGLQTQNRSFNCPSGEWGLWATTSNTCSPCPTAPQSRELQCPSGQFGSVVEQRTFNCPSGSWGAWTTVSNTCNTCPAPESRNVSCPTGQFGLIVQSRSFDCSAGQWSGWSTSSNTCAACPSAPQSETNNLTCPVGQVGSITQSRTRTFDCPSGQWNNWSAWTTTNTCQFLCTAPPPESRWVPYTANACPAGQFGSNNWQLRETRSWSCPSPSSSSAVATPWTWDGVGGQRVNDEGCSTCPAPATTTDWRKDARNPGCWAGTFGTNTLNMWQTQNVTTSFTCPFGTATLPPPNVTRTPWADTGISADQVVTCSPCPAPSTVYAGSFHSPGSALCPAGQIGFRAWDELIEIYETRSFNCPARTTTLPPASVSSISRPTGIIVNYVNTCRSACTPRPPATAWRRTGWITAGCPRWMGRPVETLHQRDFMCPSGTWGDWYSLGQTRTSPTCQWDI